MPTYEYKCRVCGSEFEKVQKMSARAGSKCPACGGKAERQLSGAGLVFKGSGFYLTDYGRSGQKKAEAERQGGEAAAKPDKPDKPDKTEKTAKPEAPAAKPHKKKDH